MIDRRRVVLGSLAGLIAPAVARAQPGLAGAGPAPAPAGAIPANAGAAGSRLQPRTGERHDAATQAPSETAMQPARIDALILSQSYQATPQFALANTARDAALIAQTFQRLRFDSVTLHRDGTAAETIARIATYLAGLDANTIAVVYLAGHGLEIAGENLLMLEGGTAFLSLQALVQVLQQRAGIAILFLDACRNNPLDRLAGGRVSRAVSLGAEGVQLQTVSLSELRGGGFDPPSRLRAFSLQGSGVRIVFSTDPANVAFDGARPNSRNSPFAQALARHVRDQVSLDDIISLTTGDVLRATRRVQSPWSQGSIDRPIFLSGGGGWRRRRQGNFR